MSDYILEQVCAIKRKAVAWLEDYTKLETSQIDAEELGAVADVVKDLFEAEKYAREACYYKSVTDAMKDTPEGDAHIKDVNREYNDKYSENYNMAHRPVAISDRMYDTITTARDIWNEADPNNRDKMKTEFRKLVDEME